MAKKVISNLQIRIDAIASGVKSGVAKANKHLAGLKGKGKGVTSSLTAGFGRMAASLAKAGPIIAGITAALLAMAAAGKKAAAHVIEVAEHIEAAALKAERLGGSLNDLLALRGLAEGAGSTADTFDMAAQRMTRRIAEAAKGTGEAVGALKELKLNASDLAKLDTAGQVEAIGRAMLDVGSAGDQVRLMMKLVDSEGVSLLQTFKAVGRDGMGAVRAEAERLGITLSKMDEENFKAIATEANRMRMALSGFGRQLAAAFAPAVLTGLRGLNSLIVTFTENVKTARYVWLRLWGESHESARRMIDTADAVSKVADAVERLAGDSIPGLADALASHVEKLKEAELGKLLSKARVDELRESVKMAFDRATSAAEGRVEILRGMLERIDEFGPTARPGVGAVDIRTQAGLSAVREGIENRKEAETRIWRKSVADALKAMEEHLRAVKAAAEEASRRDDIVKVRPHPIVG